MLVADSGRVPPKRQALKPLRERRKENEEERYREQGERGVEQPKEMWGSAGQFRNPQESTAPREKAGADTKGVARTKKGLFWS